jgi:hypothetical protein
LRNVFISQYEIEHCLWIGGDPERPDVEVSKSSTPVYLQELELTTCLSVGEYYGQQLFCNLKKIESSHSNDSNLVIQIRSSVLPSSSSSSTLSSINNYSEEYSVDDLVVDMENLIRKKTPFQKKI